MDYVVLALKAAVYLMIGLLFNWLFVNNPGIFNYWSWLWVVGWIGMLVLSAIAAVIAVWIMIFSLTWWFRTV